MSVEVKNTGLDYFRSKSVTPPKYKPDHSISVPPLAVNRTALDHVVAYSKPPSLSCALLHQQFGNISDDVLDRMCRQQTLGGLPRITNSRYAYDCAICSLGKLPQFRKGKTMSNDLIPPGSILYMEFSFWDVVSRRGFSAVFTIIDCRTHMLWVFCTGSKKPPMQLHREERTLARIHVDEDGALSGSYRFCTFFRDEAKLNLETTGGYSSFLNGKVERPNQTPTDRVRCMLINAAAPKKDWCFSVEHAADVYRVTLHSTLKRSHYEACCGDVPSAKDLPIWGCQVLVPGHYLKKADNRASEGLFYGFDKSRNLLRWLDPAMDTVEHAHGARFIKLDPTQSHPTPGQRLLSLDPTSPSCDVTFPELTIDLGDRVHFDTEPISVIVHLPLIFPCHW
jgi:hypothetical protein